MAQTQVERTRKLEESQQFKETGSPLKRPTYLNIDGLLVPGSFTRENVLDAINYKSIKDDIFISTYVKCGTTWMQYIVTLILREGKPFKDASEFFTLTPYMEMTGRQAVDKMPRPGAIKTHLPYHLTPKSPDAKYIYVARNPKDCCVSLFHHTRLFPAYMFQTGTFPEFFESFMDGYTDYGDYFDHLMGWYEHRHDPNVHFVTYEDLKADPSGGIKGVARFLGPYYGNLVENNPKILENILHYSSFEHMKTETNNFWETFLNDVGTGDVEVPEGVLVSAKINAAAISNGKAEKPTFVRKGIVGDWKNYFTKEQEDRLEEKFQQKSKGTNVISLFQDLKD